MTTPIALRPIGTGRAGAVRRRVQALLSDARGRGRMTAEHELTGVLAEKVAAVVDTAAREGDAGRMLSGIRQLRDLIDTLPVRDTREPGGGDSDDGAAPGQPAALQLLTAGPTLGDTADT